MSVGMAVREHVYTQVSQSIHGETWQQLPSQRTEICTQVKAKVVSNLQMQSCPGKEGECNPFIFLPLFHKIIKVTFWRTTWKSPPPIWNLAEDLSLPLLLRNSIKALSGTDEWMSQPILLFVLKKKSTH